MPPQKIVVQLSFDINIRRQMEGFPKLIIRRHDRQRMRHRALGSDAQLSIGSADPGRIAFWRLLSRWTMLIVIA
jgi:hypothetical protein